MCQRPLARIVSAIGKRRGPTTERGNVMTRFLIAAFLLSVAASGPEVLAQPECNIKETLKAVVLWDDDGLELALRKSDGAGTDLQVGDTGIPLGATPLIRFEEVVEPEDAPDLLADKSAEAWNVPADTVEETVNGEAGPWLRVSGGTDGKPRRSVEVNQTAPEPLVLSGWAQARTPGEAVGWWSRNLALNAHAVYRDGEQMPEQSAYFGQYDHGPQFNKKVICPDRPIARVNLELSAAGEWTAWYRDVQLRPASYNYFVPTTTLERIDHAVHQAFESRQAHLRGLVTWQPKSEHIEIRCRWESTQPLDRAVSAYLAVPIDAVGGVWHDHFRGRRTIEAGKLYRDAVWYGAGRDGYNNRYPIGCIETADGAGLAVGASVAEPRVFQTEYDAARRELRIRFDIGMSPDAGRWANRGAFTAYLYRFDARDGFRGATEKYHQILPWAFERRAERAGIWLAFMTPTSVPGDWQHFNFQFIEAVCNMGWEERQGMYSLRYAEPWIHHHEFPGHLEVDEVHGPPLPAESVAVARRIAARDDLPLDMRRRYAAYEGAYVADKWSQPDGYFFRSPKGRNENMMIVNPNDELPPPPGAHFSLGGWDREVIRETMGVWKQYWIESWSIGRTSAHPFPAVDREQKTNGRQSLRLDPVQSGSYFEQYLRAVNQVLYYHGNADGPFTFSIDARGENVPETGSSFGLRLSLLYQDGTSSSETAPLDGLHAEWKRFSVEAAPQQRPLAIRVGVETTTGAWKPDPTVLWLDNASLATGGAPDLLANGGFEKAELLECRLDGVYLDTIECYEADLNYRRAHWPYAEEPPTFDCGRAPALHQVYSHATYAKHIAQWVRPKDMIVFGNCAPNTPFVAPYLDAMGNELSWNLGGVWQPMADDKFNFVHFMTRSKPYLLLQYSDLDVDQQERYLKRCLFYGVLPSNQGGPTGGWYWVDPVAVQRHREVFARYTPFLVELAEAGWRP